MNLNDILNISDNIESTKKADHILEWPGLSCFVGHPVSSEFQFQSIFFVGNTIDILKI